MLAASRIADFLEANPEAQPDPLVISPTPNLKELRKSGGASVDLRLGTWFLTTKARRVSLLDVYGDDIAAKSPGELTNKYYMPFGEEFILHPRSFVLSVTLEWLRIPLGMAGMVAGKSSWGRMGLIIETAPGIQPGFTGCLTLELTNVGDIPIAIKPGTSVCQLFLYQLDQPATETPPSRFMGQRQPRLSPIVLDDFAKNLAR
jgi:dCTP deaminase